MYIALSSTHARASAQTHALTFPVLYTEHKIFFKTKDANVTAKIGCPKPALKVGVSLGLAYALHCHEDVISMRAHTQIDSQSMNMHAS